MPVDLISGEDTLPGLPVAFFSLYPHIAEREEKKKRKEALLSLIKAQIPL